MGRKIPGRKHHGVRDPEKQNLERLKKIQHKINAPPKDPDDQQVPRSLQKIMDWKERTKNREIPSKKIESMKKKSLNSAYEKPVPEFIQGKGESDEVFMNRVNNVCKEVIHEAHFEDKFKVQVKRNEITGQIEGVVKRPKDELEVLISKAKQGKKKKSKKKKGNSETDITLTKGQKRLKKLKEKKEKKNDEMLQDKSEIPKDVIGFGEVVHAPPTLTLPRKVEKGDAPRPGRKELLLKSIISGNKTFEADVPQNRTNLKVNLHKPTNKVIDKKGKRKKLPNLLRTQLEKQQQDVIQAYKTLKLNKQKERNV